MRPIAIVMTVGPETTIEQGTWSANDALQLKDEHASLLIHFADATTVRRLIAVLEKVREAMQAQAAV